MKDAVYLLYNESGILVIQDKINNDHEILDINKLPSGNYYLILKYGSNVIRKKIVKL
jgi:hypothetical protein